MTDTPGVKDSPARRLARYWAHGEGAAKIGWGTPGSYERGVAELSKHLPPEEVHGYVANIYHEATGTWPGAHHGLTKSAHSGAMIALFPDHPDMLVTGNGEPMTDLHVTLAYLGPAAEIGDDARRQILQAVEAVCDTYRLPGDATVAGVGMFEPESGPVPVVALIDMPDLAEFRTALVATVNGLTGLVATDHDFVPHMTIDYAEDQGQALQVISGWQHPGTVRFGTIAVCFGDLRYVYSIGGTEAVAKAASAEQRFTLMPWYIPDKTDAHNEWTDAAEIQQGLWSMVRKDDRRIRLQHVPQIVAGEMLEAMVWPYPITLPMYKADGSRQDVDYPAGTAFMGVKWQPWAWTLVKSGKITGLSMGGRAKRIRGIGPGHVRKNAFVEAEHPRDLVGKFTHVLTKNTVAHRKEMRRALDEAGYAEDHPLRGVLHETVSGNHVLVTRDETGKVVAGTVAHIDGGAKARSVHIKQVRVVPRREGIGQAHLALLAREVGPQGEMAVSGAVPDAKPFYAKTGATFQVDSTYGKWSSESIAALQAGLTPPPGEVIDRDTADRRERERIAREYPAYAAELAQKDPRYLDAIDAVAKAGHPYDGPRASDGRFGHIAGIHHHKLTGDALHAHNAAHGKPKHAPGHAKTVTSAKHVTPGDTLYLKNQDKGFEVHAVDADTGTVHVKSGKSKIAVKVDAEAAKGHPYAVVHAPGTSAYYLQHFVGDPTAPKPPSAPEQAVPISSSHMLHPGDTLYLSTSDKGWTVKSVDGDKMVVQNGKSTQKIVKPEDAKGGKAYAVVPGPDKGKHLKAAVETAAAPEPHHSDTVPAEPAKPAGVHAVDLTKPGTYTNGLVILTVHPNGTGDLTNHATGQNYAASENELAALNTVSVPLSSQPGHIPWKAADTTAAEPSPDVSVGDWVTYNGAKFHVASVGTDFAGQKVAYLNDGPNDEGDWHPKDPAELTPTNEPQAPGVYTNAHGNTLTVHPGGSGFLQYGDGSASQDIEAGAVDGLMGVMGEHEFHPVSAPPTSKGGWKVGDKAYLPGAPGDGMVTVYNLGTEPDAVYVETSDGEALPAGVGALQKTPPTAKPTFQVGDKYVFHNGNGGHFDGKTVTVTAYDEGSDGAWVKIDGEPGDFFADAANLTPATGTETWQHKDGSVATIAPDGQSGTASYKSGKTYELGPAGVAKIKASPKWQPSTGAPPPAPSAPSGPAKFSTGPTGTALAHNTKIHADQGSTIAPSANAPSQGGFSGSSQHWAQPGEIVGHTNPDFAGNTYQVLGSDDASGTSVITTAAGTNFDAKHTDLAPLGPGHKVKTPAGDKTIADIVNGQAIFDDGTSEQVSALQPATAITGKGAAAGASTSSKKIDYNKPIPSTPAAYGSVPLSHVNGARTFTGNSDGVHWGDSWWADWRDSLSKEQQHGLAFYTGSGYHTWNGTLRSGGTPSGDMKAAMDALNGTELPEAAILSRGIGVSITSDMVGSVFYDRGFQSTSAAPNAAFSSKTTIMRIHAPAGTKGAYLGQGSHSSFGNGEMELLLPPGAAYRIDAVTKGTDGRLYADVTLVAQGLDVDYMQTTLKALGVTRLWTVGDWVS